VGLGVYDDSAREPRLGKTEEGTAYETKQLIRRARDESTA